MKMGQKVMLWVTVPLLAVIPLPAAANDEKLTNSERYICTAEARTSVGRVSASRELDGEGNLVNASASWWTTDGDLSAGPAAMAGWAVSGDDPAQFLGGWFLGKVAMGTRSAPQIARSARFRMEITTHAVASRWGTSGAFVGEYGKWKDFASSSRGVFADWDDLYAMARGGNGIIVARDRQKNLLGSYAIPYATLSQAREEAIRLSAEVHALAQNYKEECEEIGSVILI